MDLAHSSGMVLISGAVDIPNRAVDLDVETDIHILTQWSRIGPLKFKELITFLEHGANHTILNPMVAHQFRMYTIWTDNPRRRLS